jgi:hypothetical protein
MPLSSSGAKQVNIINTFRPCCYMVLFVLFIDHTMVPFVFDYSSYYGAVFVLMVQSIYSHNQSIKSQLSIQMSYFSRA